MTVADSCLLNGGPAILQAEPPACPFPFLPLLNALLPLLMLGPPKAPYLLLGLRATNSVRFTVFYDTWKDFIARGVDHQLSGDVFCPGALEFTCFR